MHPPAHLLPAPPCLAQILAAPGPVECMCTRRERAAGRPLLFAGIMAVATPPMRRRQRHFTPRPGASLLPVTPSSSPPHRSSRARATAFRLPELLFHREKAAGEAFYRTDKPSVVRQHCTSTRARCSDAEAARAAVWALPVAAAAAARLGGRPQ